jgi:hypothetical protein
VMTGNKSEVKDSDTFLLYLLRFAITVTQGDCHNYFKHYHCESQRDMAIPCLRYCFSGLLRTL